MKILVLNAGSSSLKYQLVDMATETAILTGICERITAAGGVLTQKTKDGKKLVVTKDMPTHKEALELVLNALVDPEYGAIKSVDEVSAVGHRVVHGGEDFTTSVVIDDEVIAICERNSDLAPLPSPPFT